MKRLGFFAGLPLVCLFVLGCGGGGEGEEDRVATFETTGVVTLDGKPVAEAVVTFSPKGEQPSAIGRTASDGSFSLRTYEDGDGAAAGDYVVLVSKSTVTASGPVAHDPNNPGAGGPAAHAGGARATMSKSELPEKYRSPAQSDLQATVKEGGENNFKLELKS